MRCNQKGSGIVEGVVGLWMVIGAGVCAALLVLNSGAGIYFKEKLVIVTNMAAQFASAHSSDSNLDSEVQNYVQSLLPECGMTPSQLNVHVTAPATFIANGQQQTGVQVVVSNQFNLFGNGTVLPCQIQLSDTEFAASGSGLGGGLPVIGAISIRSNDTPNSEPTELLVPVVYEGNNGNNLSTVNFPLTNPAMPNQLAGLPDWNMDLSVTNPATRRAPLPQ
jgi:hypothetical protein